MNRFDHEPPESRLERLLRLAAGDPSRRAEFLEALLDAEVLVPGDTAGTAADGESLTLQLREWQREDGSSAIPFFTSREVLEASIEGEERYLQLAARDLFEAVRGTTLLLNPCSPYGREFTPGDIEALLAPVLVEHRIAPGSKVVIGQPADYPAALVDALTGLFARHASVRRAFLAQVYEPASGDPPHLVVGLDARGSIDPLIAAAAALVREAAPRAGFVDFMPLSPADAGGVSGYFLDSRPFYERRWGRRLRTLLGGGHA